MKTRRVITMIAITTSLVLAGIWSVAAEDLVSAPGKYAGYSPVLSGVFRWRKLPIRPPSANL